MPEYPEIRRFGEKLRALRTARGLTVRELAAELGYAAHGYVHGVEQGRNKPTPELILRIAIFFGVSTDQLLRDDLELDAPS
jgi:transcriptional regulator with XRE-family HTH domain